MIDAAKLPGTLRLASYNIRKCVGLDRKRDPSRVLGVVADLNADVVALQEADRRLGKRPTSLPFDMITEQTNMRALRIGTNSVSLGWHGNAILVQPSIAVTDVRPLELPGLEPRGAIWVELCRGGTPFQVVATHLGLSRRHRRQQLAMIADHLRERSDAPAIILGDFNEWSATKGLEALDNRYTVFAPGRSFHSARPVAALDRIAYNDGFELVSAGVYAQGDAPRASDHLPIWADMTLVNAIVR